MLRAFILLVLFATLQTSCRNSDNFIIEGIVPDPVFEGTNVYLVALDAPLTKNVDSTIIRNSTFSFEVKADSMAVKILRIPAKFPRVVEDLVVIPETGKIEVIMDSISTGKGPRLNKILQEWKERKRIHDSKQWELYSMMRSVGTDSSLTDSLAIVSREMNDIFVSDLICMINDNLFNGIGLLIYKVYFDALPAGEKNYVTEMTGKLYIERDAQLRARFY